MRWLWWFLGIVVIFGLGFFAGTAVGGFSGAIGGMYVGGCAVANEAVEKNLVSETQLRDLLQSAMRNKLGLSDAEIKGAAEVAKKQEGEAGNDGPCQRVLRTFGS